MLSLFLGSSSEFIQVSEDDVRKIVENISHVSLEHSTYVLESKRHDKVSKCTPWGGRCNFILIYWMDLDLIVAKEPIHEVQVLMACIVIDNLVNERVWEVVFGTTMIAIMKFSADVNSALFFVNGDRVGDPYGIHDGLYQPDNT
jgi:hypothetical protein